AVKPRTAAPRSCDRCAAPKAAAHKVRRYWISPQRFKSWHRTGHEKHRSGTSRKEKGHIMAEATQVTTLTAPDISCGHCVSAIQNRLGELDGVSSVVASADTKQIDL